MFIEHLLCTRHSSWNRRYYLIYLPIYLKMIKIKGMIFKNWDNGYFWDWEGDGIERDTNGFKVLIIAIIWMLVCPHPQIHILTLIPTLMIFGGWDFGKCLETTHSFIFSQLDPFQHTHFVPPGSTGLVSLVWNFLHFTATLCPPSSLTSWAAQRLGLRCF